MSNRTPLYDCHREAGAQLVDFSGWEMPLHYGSQIQEHHRVRESVGMFDVSHMGVLDITGAGANDFLRYALANDIAKLTEAGKALYSCMLNDKGGVIDDLIVYRLGENDFRLVLNAGTRDSDLKWLQTLAKDFEVTLTERTDLSIIAVQGPGALSLLDDMLSEPIAEKLQRLELFQFLIAEDIMIARTGYTGEDGVEIILPSEDAKALWEDLLNEEVAPCGLGARDTLRLEAGFNLYGLDMDATTSPLISNLAWTVSLKDKVRDFVGRAALEKVKANGVIQKLVGLEMEVAGVLRDHQTVFVEGLDDGEITSGSFSPTLGHAIALARVPIDTGDTAEVERRGQRIPVKVVTLPFVKKKEPANA